LIPVESARPEGVDHVIGRAPGGRRRERQGGMPLELGVELGDARVSTLGLTARRAEVDSSFAVDGGLHALEPVAAHRGRSSAAHQLSHRHPLAAHIVDRVPQPRVLLRVPRARAIVEGRAVKDVAGLERAARAFAWRRRIERVRVVRAPLKGLRLVVLHVGARPQRGASAGCGRASQRRGGGGEAMERSALGLWHPGWRGASAER